MMSLRWGATLQRRPRWNPKHTADSKMVGGREGKQDPITRQGDVEYPQRHVNEIDLRQQRQMHVGNTQVFGPSHIGGQIRTAANLGGTNRNVVFKNS